MSGNGRLSFWGGRHVGKVVVLVLFLATMGTGVYYYMDRETKLTFHSSWTETDRRQMQEIMNWVVVQRESFEQMRDKKRKEMMDSLSFGRIKNDWKSVWSDFRERRKEYYNIWSPFLYLDGIVSRTARTGDACYIGEDDFTLLHLACGLGKKELACHLMEKGADVNIRVRPLIDGKRVPGDMPWHYLFCRGMDSRSPLDAETVLLLMEKAAAHGADFNARSAGELMNSFELLCLWGREYTEEEREKILSRLIALGGDVVSPSLREQNMISPFELPVQSGYPGVVRRLCEEGADVNAEYDYLPPLFFVCSFRSDNMLEVARILLDHGAHINVQIKSKSFAVMGQTPLSHVCSQVASYSYNEKLKKNAIELVSLYLERNADVNLATEEGTTPLMFLFRNGAVGEKRDFMIELARMLLKHGADPSLKDNNGKTVLDMIRKFKDDEKKILDELPELTPVR